MSLNKQNYAKALSAFSNSSGGVIIWEVKAKKDKKYDDTDLAGEGLPIKPLRTCLTNLNSFIGKGLSPANFKSIKNNHHPIVFFKLQDNGYHF
ncbi:MULTISPECIES: hypothetical protein [Saccharibacillus]|uniref:hypothetical protein n=1 Tax=Saccharibacillus TaxID=456492 RepID=UPI0012396016|nr:hypothetical protein [Saccharibacillus sp. WB 17]MWJ32154.1 hypothetical protein [Saccharibacillus sp. WB 17]